MFCWTCRKHLDSSTAKWPNINWNFTFTKNVKEFWKSVKDQHQVTSDSRVTGRRGHSSLSQMEEFSWRPAKHKIGQNFNKLCDETGEHTAVTQWWCFWFLKISKKVTSWHKYEVWEIFSPLVNTYMTLYISWQPTYYVIEIISSNLEPW